MTISVIIPTFNEQQHITACLRSLLTQTLKPQEIIVIDDGSTDQTKALVKKIPSVKLLAQSHQGPAAARNLGAAKAKGQILVFVDADMEFDQDFISQLTRPIRNQKAKGTWSGNELVKNWSNLWAKSWNHNQGRRTAKMISQTKAQRPVFRAILKSEFDKVNGFDQIGYTDDWSLGSKLGYQPKVTTAKFYHHNPNSLIEVFHQANWIGKRNYKLGKLGILITIIRSNAAFSILIGLYKSIIYLNPAFLVFKLVYDLGIMFGAIQSLSGNKY